MSVTSTMRAAARKARHTAEPSINSHIDPTKSSVHRAANAGAVISAVVIGVVALVGILIFAQVNGSLPEPNNSDLANSQDSVVSGFGGAMELVPVILIVLLASVVIVYVQRMRQ